MHAVEGETKALFRRREELRKSVDLLKTKEQELQLSVQGLESEKRRVEQFLELGESQLQWVLEQALIRLKVEKPELFFMSDSEQMGLLVCFLFRIFTK